MLQFSPLCFKCTFVSKETNILSSYKMNTFYLVYALSPLCNWDSPLQTYPTLHHLVQNEDHVSEKM